MTLAQTPETSVMFSLAELAHIEHERVQEEAAQRAELARDEERARRAALEAERAKEKARVEAEQLRRADHERAKAEELARRAARERAELEVARIAAEAKVTLDRENASRAHELQLVQLRDNSDRARLRHALMGLVSLVVLGGATAAWAVNGHVTELREESQTLRDDRWAATQVHEQGLSAELAWLDARHTELGRRHGGLEGDALRDAQQRSEAARSAIEASGSDTPKLHAFAKALAELDAAVVRAERLASYDARVADLSPLARGNAERELAQVVAAQRAAHQGRDFAALDRALDGLRQALASAGGKPTTAGATRPTTRTGTPPAATTGRRCTNPHDPMCGPDGMLLQTH